MRIVWRAPLLSILFLMTLPNARAADCPVQGSSVKDAVSFLKAAKSNNNVPAECIVAAIHKLYKVRSKEAIDILIEYLDYEPWKEEQVVTGSNAEPPAVDELFAVGRPALPALVKVLERTDISNVARKNAVQTIMLIYRDDPPAGISFLVKEAAKTSDGESSLLRQAASDALRWCSGKHHDQCELALSSP